MLLPQQRGKYMSQERAISATTNLRKALRYIIHDNLKQTFLKFLTVWQHSCIYKHEYAIDFLKVGTTLWSTQTTVSTFTVCNISFKVTRRFSRKVAPSNYDVPQGGFRQSWLFIPSTPCGHPQLQNFVSFFRYLRPPPLWHGAQKLGH